MLHDIPEYLKGVEDAERGAKAQTPEPQGKGKRTAAGVKPPTMEAGGGGSESEGPAGSHTELQTADGVLTDEGAAFLKKKYPKRFYAKKNAEIRADFVLDPGGALLEAVVLEEMSRVHAEMGPSKDHILLQKRRFKSLPRLLGKRVKVNAAVLQLPVLEFIRQYMPNEFAFMENFTDPGNPERQRIVREQWRRFAWEPRKKGKQPGGFMLGDVANKEFDAAEFLLDRDLVVVTDSTHPYNNPIHNFKTLFYALVIETATGLQAGSTDYRSAFRQNPIELGQGAPRAPRGQTR
jgi:hypothetical protein